MQPLCKHTSSAHRPAYRCIRSRKMKRDYRHSSQAGPSHLQADQHIATSTCRPSCASPLHIAQHSPTGSLSSHILCIPQLTSLSLSVVDSLAQIPHGGSRCGRQRHRSGRPFGQNRDELQPKKSSASTMRRFVFRSLKWPFSSKEVNQLLASLERHEKTILLGLQIDQT